MNADLRNDSNDFVNDVKIAVEFYISNVDKMAEIYDALLKSKNGIILSSIDMIFKAMFSMKYFGTASANLSILIPIIKVFSTISGTEASSERLFSQIKFILNELRGNYSEEGFTKEVFISYNVDKVNNWSVGSSFVSDDELEEMYSYVDANAVRIMNEFARECILGLYVDEEYPF